MVAGGPCSVARAELDEDGGEARSAAPTVTVTGMASRLDIARARLTPDVAVVRQWPNILKQNTR